MFFFPLAAFILIWANNQEKNLVDYKLPEGEFFRLDLSCHNALYIV